MRVHELATELMTTSRDVLAHLAQIGVTGKSHSSSLTDEEANRIREIIAREFAEATGTVLGTGEAVPTPAPPPAETAPATPSTPVESKPEERAEGGPVEAPAEQPAAAPAQERPASEVSRKGKTITVKPPIIVKDLAMMMDMKPNLLIAELMSMNIFASINQKIDIKAAKSVAQKHGWEIDQEKPQAPKQTKPREQKVKTEKAAEIEDLPENMEPRAPVVTFLGHVDHGKTSLLDHIRKDNVAEGESGGITQHIGAYTVQFEDHPITFLDTPGHAAFTAMRARGASLTDIAVLVVAADDGVMPQTREAIQHAKAAGVTIVVAANKMDMPKANLERVKQQLQEADLMPEDWGGQIGVCPVSAKTGEGMDSLLERILLEAEVLELQANPRRKASGYVIEARLEPGMGPTATVLVKTGTLEVGQSMVCGGAYGKIKALINDKGHKVRSAGPSAAVKCLGLNSVPEAGQEFQIFKNDREARALAEKTSANDRRESLQGSQRGLSLDDLFAQTDSAEKKELPIVLKCDVQGSLEAIEQSLNEIQSEKVKLNMVLTGVGNVTVNDVLLAKASKGLIIGFHVGKENGVSATAKREDVEIRLYSVIYELIDDVKRAMTGLLEPEYRENVIGHAEIREIFDIGKTGRIAGCMVTDGRVRFGSKARVKRGNETLYEGTVASLKRFQSDAKEVRDGQECGIGLDNFAAFDRQDIIECYEMERLAQSL